MIRILFLRFALAICVLDVGKACFAQSGFAGLGDAGDGYEKVSANRKFSFPVDHGAHPNYRIEWWYLTANLTDTNGTPIGLQWTLFRNALRPPSDDAVNTEQDNEQFTNKQTSAGWQNSQFWMANAAITTVDQHLYKEKFGRGGIGQAGVTLNPFNAWLDDWTMVGKEGSGLELAVLEANGANFSYELEIKANGPFVPQGENGYSIKSPYGQASYYYSQPFYQAKGRLIIHGKVHDVIGTAWLDREWSSQPLAADQTGWDWFSLNLNSGEKLMLFRLRTKGIDRKSKNKGSSGEPGDKSALADTPKEFTSGTWISADGSPENLQGRTILFSPKTYEKIAGRDIPVAWRVSIPSKGLDIDTVPLNAKAYMETVFPYWEGPIRFSGTHHGQGYLEMTGY
ncbi:MAG: lipocalin-like domain-containing protein [Pseudomonadota bacterium]